MRKLRLSDLSNGQYGSVLLVVPDSCAGWAGGRVGRGEARLGTVPTRVGEVGTGIGLGGPVRWASALASCRRECGTISLGLGRAAFLGHLRQTILNSFPSHSIASSNGRYG